MRFNSLGFVLSGMLCLARPNIEAKGFIVHEWGTFTTLNNSAGQALSGLYKDTELLPTFVETLPFYKYDSLLGWPSPKKLRHVNVKMETPILYFYSPEAKNVQVKVGFQNGTINQWYPACDSGENNPGPLGIDFEKPYQGFVFWNFKVLAPLDTHKVWYPNTTSIWSGPRGVTANLVQGKNGEIEKFLFYRGLGGFASTLPIQVHFNLERKLVVENQDGLNVGYIFVYENTRMGDKYLWWQGNLGIGKSVILNRPPNTSPDTSIANAKIKFRESMVQAGLTNDEALVLIEKWKYSYFEESGLKVFWLLPRPLIDHILPLTISPIPDSLERVIVGRSDILTPEFEDTLRTALQHGTLSQFQNDKYYLAYLNALQLSSPIRFSRSNSVKRVLTRAGKSKLVTPSFYDPNGNLRDSRGKSYSKKTSE